MSLLNKFRNWTSLPRVAPFVPKSIICLLEGYTTQKFSKDLIAGATVGVLSLPLAMALAISAGVDPQRGLYTACVAGFLISLLGGSRFLVGGPTGAFVALIYAIISRSGYQGLQIATLMAGLLLVLFGIFRLGALIRFVSFPVIIGFTNGIAITLAIAQLNGFFGFHIDHPSPEAFGKLKEAFFSLPDLAILPTSYAIGTLFLIWAFKRINKKIPAVMCALIIIVAIQMYFQLPVPTIESAFGAIPRSLPSPEIPSMSFDLLCSTFPDAFSIALLGAIESLLCAVIADSMASTKHKSDCELVGQGVANVGSALFGGMPATAAVARTVANVQLHAKTPFAGIFHALTILLLMWCLAPYANAIPLSALAAVLLFVAWNMFEFEEMKAVIKGSRSEALVMIVTLIVTVLVHISTAVQIGVLLSIIHFMKKMVSSTTAKEVSFEAKQTIEHIQEESTVSDSFDQQAKWLDSLSDQTKVLEIEGPFFFGVSDILAEVLPSFSKTPKRLVLRFRLVPFIDQTGIQALALFKKRCEKAGIDLYFSEIKNSVLKVMEKSELIEAIGKDHVLRSPQEILELDSPLAIKA